MRSLVVAVAAVLLSGCTEVNFIQPSQQFMMLETWMGVRPSPDSVEADVGDVLHLPVDCDLAGDLSRLSVTVNGTAVKPEFEKASTSITLVFRAKQAGTFLVEVKQAPSQDTVGVWNVTVSAGFGVE